MPPEPSSPCPPCGRRLALLGANLAGIRRRMSRACERAGRDPAGVRLVVVTKTVSSDVVHLLSECGVSDAAENRVQVAAPKIEDSPPGMRWHFVGHLQSNKARKAARMFATIHSIDSLDLGRRVARAACDTGRLVDAFVQINVAEEPQKHGVLPAQAAAVIRDLATLEGLRLVGLMTIAPLGGDLQEARRVFRTLRGLRDELAGTRGEQVGRTTRPPGSHGARWGLSMGMTDDFEVAIEEGASVVRIGRAVFQGLAR